MLQGLPETETGVQQDLVEPHSIQPGYPLRKEIPHLSHHILVHRIPLHRLRRPLDVHHHIRNTRLGDVLKHPLVHCPSRNIVNHHRTETGDNLLRHLRPEGIDGHTALRIVLPDQFHRPRQPAQLLLFIHDGRTGTSGISTHVYDRRPLLHNLVDTLYHPHFAEILSAVIKRIRSDVQNPHYYRTGKIHFPFPQSDTFHPTSNFMFFINLINFMNFTNFSLNLRAQSYEKSIIYWK